MRSNTIAVAVFVTLLVTACVAVIGSAPAQAAKPLFEKEEPIQAVLSAPITQVYKEKKKDIRLYREGTVSYKDAQGQTHRLKVKIRTRGNFRRTNCSRPPLSLNFAKKSNDGTLFAQQDILKLVGPCQKRSSYQEYVGLEYLAYKLWQEMSPYHFRTRLIELSYVDTDKKKKLAEATTFVIEDISDVAERVNRKRLKLTDVTQPQMDFQQTALLELFQLLIGNSDYSTLVGPVGKYCCHNARLLVEPGKTDDAIPVPYDFDASGLVNATYATPPEQYPIKDVRQRYFTGWCKEDARFVEAIDRFREKKASLYQIVESVSVIDEKSRKKTLQYLDSFYEVIEDPKRVQREVIDRCRGPVIKG